MKTRWDAATPDERAREREQSRRASAKYRTRIRALIEEAKDTPCSDCGKRYPKGVMDFDHVRGRKTFNVSKAVQLATGVTFEAIRAEIAKCDIVCANCHRIRTERAKYRGRRTAA